MLSRKKIRETLVLVEIISDRACGVLLSDLYNIRIVLELLFLDYTILCMGGVERMLIAFDLLGYLTSGERMVDLLLEHKVQGLTDAGGLYTFHDNTSFFLRTIYIIPYF